MKNVLICGIETEMGKSIHRALTRSEDLNVVCGVTKNFSFDIIGDLPVYESFEEVNQLVDIVIDVSSPDNIDEVLSFALENKIALLEGTHGFNKKQKEQIVAASEHIPVFLSVNASIGVLTTVALCIEAAKRLPDFDVEIIEEHQAEKANAPSTTAKLLAETISEALGGNKIISSGRNGNSARNKNEICIHSVRGGGLSGQTKIMFIGQDETVSIIHNAHSRFIYADSTDKIVNFIVGKPAGLYDLSDFFSYR